MYAEMNSLSEKPQMKIRDEILLYITLRSHCVWCVCKDQRAITITFACKTFYKSSWKLYSWILEFVSGGSVWNNLEDKNSSYLNSKLLRVTSHGCMVGLAVISYTGSGMVIQWLN